MISRSAIGRNAQLALRRQSCAQPANRRGLAASVSGSTSFSYDTADVGGVKVASRDVAGPTTKLAVVAKAGTRYQSLPGLTAGLEQFAFKVWETSIEKDLMHWATVTDPFFSEHPQEICSTNHERIRAPWKSIDCIPYERVLGCRGQIPT
jgi:hypothetical protein